MALVSQMSWWGVENCISEPAVTATQVWAIMSVATDDVVVVLLVSVWDNHDFSFSSFNAFVFCLFFFSCKLAEAKVHLLPQITA